jgi:hypothetical protein
MTHPRMLVSFYSLPIDYLKGQVTNDHRNRDTETGKSLGNTYDFLKVLLATMQGACLLLP